jgi:hypothetical protein
VLSDRITLGVEIPEADCAGPVTLDDAVACLVKKLRIGP